MRKLANRPKAWHRAPNLHWIRPGEMGVSKISLWLSPITGTVSYDDPVWQWAWYLNLPFGCQIRFGKGGGY